MGEWYILRGKSYSSVGAWGLMRSDNSVLGRVIRKVLSGREIKQSLKEGSNALRKYWGKESPYGNTQAVNLGFPEVLLEG